MNRTAMSIMIVTIGAGIGVLPLIVFGGEAEPPIATAEPESSSSETRGVRPEARAGDQQRAASGLQPVSSLMGDDPLAARAVMQKHMDLGLYDPANTESPNVGDLAPDFTLKALQAYEGQLSLAADEEVTLSQLVGNLPVVLIFGSYT